MTQVSELTSDLSTITAEINAYKRVAGEAIFEIGRRLKHVKENDLTHGQWERWCREEAGFDPATAFKFIRVYNELGGANLATWQEIGWRALYEIATLPPEERTREHTLKSGVTKTVDEMTVRELREVKAALKEERERCEREREARERAEMRAIKAEESYEVLRDTFDAAFSSPPGDDGVYRIDTSTEVDGTAVRFSTDVRDFIKRYSFLHHYEGEFRKLNTCSAEEYHNALAGLRSFVIEISRVLAFSSSSDGIIIDIH